MGKLEYSHFKLNLNKIQFNGKLFLIYNIFRSFDHFF